MAIFNYKFEELPLAIVDGIEAGLVNGQAVITYTPSGLWRIAYITLEGFGERVNGVRQWPQVECPKAIADIIKARLEGEWSYRVENAISDRRETDRENAAEYRAEMRRENRMMERV